MSKSFRLLMAVVLIGVMAGVFGATSMGSPAKVSATDAVGGIFLSPTEAVNAIGTEHTLPAKVLDEVGSPIVGTQVTFTITGGPNAGLTATVATVENGEATFTYTSAVEGTDTIQACYDGYVPGVQSTAVQSQICSNVVTKTWQAPVPPIPELSTMVLFGVGLLMLAGLAMFTRWKASAA